jgi:hypothetical protein
VEPAVEAPAPEVEEAVAAGDGTDAEGVEMAASISDAELEAEALAAGEASPTEAEAPTEEPAAEPTKRRGLLRRKRGDA